MAITREDVLHVARLARLEIPEDEVETVREQLGAILEAVGKVGELDLSEVEPTSHPLALVNAGSGRRGLPGAGGRRLRAVAVSVLSLPERRATRAHASSTLEAGGGPGWPQGLHP